MPSRTGFNGVWRSCAGQGALANPSPATFAHETGRLAMLLTSNLRCEAGYVHANEALALNMTAQPADSVSQRQAGASLKTGVHINSLMC